MSQLTIEVMDDNQSEWMDWLHTYGLQHVHKHKHWRILIGDALQSIDGSRVRITDVFKQNGYTYLVISNKLLSDVQIKKKFTVHVNSINISDAIWHLKQSWNIQ